MTEFDKNVAFSAAFSNAFSAAFSAAFRAAFSAIFSAGDKYGFQKNQVTMMTKPMFETALYLRVTLRTCKYSYFSLFRSQLFLFFQDK